jgi:hypothetical protein
MRLTKSFAGLLLFITFASAQDLGLKDYVQRLGTTPGVNVEQKIEFLSNMGVTLSDQGMRDLLKEANQPTTTPKANPYSNAYKNPYSYTPPTSTYTYSPLQPVTTPTIPLPSTGTANRIGNYDYFNLDNGVTGTSNRIGNVDYYSFSNGLNGTSSRIGNYTYQNWSDGVTGTGSRIGNYDYLKWSDGSSATQNKIGNTTYTNLSNGKTCTTQKIGTYSYTNCN